MTGGTVTSDPVEVANRAALRAARHSGVEVRLLGELSDLHAACELFNGIWRPDSRNPLMTIELLRAMAHAGNYVAGAFDKGKLVAACVGFFAAPPDAVLHSHIAGVVPSARGRGVGFAVKLHQRAWALERGLSQISWTFDPLVRRNAYFNLVKLGARPSEYLVDFYGDIGDAINADQGTDRLLVTWDLTSTMLATYAEDPRERDIGALRAAGASCVLAESESGRPEAASVSVRSAARTALVQVPADIEEVRRSQPRVALKWRLAVRDVLGELMAGGARVTAFTHGWYVVERETG